MNENPIPVEKPPLGVMPRKLWEEKVGRERTAALLGAIERFTRASRTIPEEWIVELRSLTGTEAL